MTFMRGRRWPAVSTVPLVMLLAMATPPYVVVSGSLSHA